MCAASGLACFGPRESRQLDVAAQHTSFDLRGVLVTRLSLDPKCASVRLVTLQHLMTLQAGHDLEDRHAFRGPAGRKCGDANDP
jgi:hypothetical protein